MALADDRVSPMDRGEQAELVRIRAADCLADSAGLLLAGPSEEHAEMLAEALRLYRLAATECVSA